MSTFDPHLRSGFAFTTMRAECCTWEWKRAAIPANEILQKEMFHLPTVQVFFHAFAEWCEMRLAFQHRCDPLEDFAPVRPPSEESR